MSNDWPQGWYRGEGAGAPPRGPRSSSGGPSARRSEWPEQPSPGRPGGGRPGGARPGGGRPPRVYGRRRRPRIGRIIAAIVVILLVVIVGSYFWLDGKLHRTVTLPTTSNSSQGTNWLITGNDSRAGLSRTQADAMHVGMIEGEMNSDSIMLLHIGAGKPELISIPRDSYVEIPGHGHNKLNAALGIGGPTLLTETIENVTGLTINHYMSIGFGGLVSVTNALGGVQMCLHSSVHDSYSGANLKPGCQNLNGDQALAFVRDRHSFATGDLQRIQNQRAYLNALLKKSMSPGTYLNPFVAFPFANNAASAITVDKGTHLIDLLQVGMALQSPASGTVPIADPALPTDAGEAVEWDHSQALQMFDDMKQDTPLPANLLKGTEAP